MYIMTYIKGHPLSILPGGINMKIMTNIETIDAIKTVLEAQSDKPQNIRVFMAGFG